MLSPERIILTVLLCPLTPGPHAALGHLQQCNENGCRRDKGQSLSQLRSPAEVQSSSGVLLRSRAAQEPEVPSRRRETCFLRMEAVTVPGADQRPPHVHRN
ncbi:unnamed protein product [Pleuronectes platessa]|uniref:Uncharacterized protein n=1 Tax=Pleuronectes platessa TaxID=8262 RepID=A0A9N7UR55_PLEPL|nr:unnamed protein product [Pleuronectes platessa]